MQIDIDQSIQFIDYDINVVCADTCGDHSDPFVFVPSGMGNEFPFLFDDINGVEEIGHLRDSSGITNQYYCWGNIFWKQVEMIYGAVGIEDEFSRIHKHEYK